jgi:hypothetical protein
MTASERHLRAESKWPSLPPEAWPPRHKEAWDEACRRDSPIRRGGRAASLAPATRRGMTQTYGQFVRWLRDTCNLDQQADPASQMARDLLAEFVAERRKAVRDSVIYGNLRTLKMMMNCLAPGCDWNWIPRQTGGPSLQEARVTRRHRQLFPPGQLLHRLVIAMQKAMQIPVDRVPRDRIRNCLMVALAVISELRLRNVAFMRLGRNLIERKAGWDIMFDADEVKNDAAILCHVPALFSPFIERYLTVDRPRTIAKRGRHRCGLGIAATTQARPFIGKHRVGLWPDRHRDVRVPNHIAQRASRRGNTDPRKRSSSAGNCIVGAGSYEPPCGM